MSLPCFYIFGPRNMITGEDSGDRRRQGILGETKIAVHAHAGWTGGVPPALFTEFPGKNKGKYIIYSQITLANVLHL